MQGEFQRQFNLITSFNDYRDWGYKVLPISGRFIRNNINPVSGGFDMDGFVFRLKAMLPSDVRLVTVDGIAFRMSPMRDEYRAVFASKSWLQVEEGAMLPQLEPIFLLNAPKDEDGKPISRLQVIYPQKDVGVIVKFDKRSHYFEHQASEETENIAVLAVIPYSSE